MRVRTLSVVGLGVAALVLSSMAAGSATAASPDGRSLTASGGSVSAGVASSNAATTSPDAVKCGANFGTGFDDGIIAWAGAGFDVQGAADFKCPKKKKKRTFKTVTVHGYFGDAGSSGFNVTVYGDSGGEPDDGNVICSTTGTGSPTGAAYPVFDVVKIPLDSKCQAKKGKNWIAVQADASVGGAWYWRTSSTMTGSSEGDWRDTGDAFGTGCTTHANGRDMESCIFGGDVGQNDFMFELS